VFSHSLYFLGTPLLAKLCFAFLSPSLSLCPSGVSPDGLDLHWIPPSERLPLPGSRQVLQAGRDHAGMTIPVLKSLYNPLILTIFSFLSAYEKQRQKTKALSVKNENTV